MVQGSNGGTAPEADLVRDAVRSIAEHGIAPRASAVDRDNARPADLWRRMGDLGAFALGAGGRTSCRCATPAERRGDRHGIDGSEMGTTWGPDADVPVVYADPEGRLSGARRSVGGRMRFAPALP